MKRRPMAEPQNAEVGIFIKRPRKVNLQQGNLKNNILMGRLSRKVIDASF